jgi:hypothetical protein
LIIEERYEEAEVIETIFSINRFTVRIQLKGGKIMTLPRAKYVWLKSNPSFRTFPKGYVIHHLDFDPTNDDPSNLALMHHRHHLAFHIKQKNIVTEVTIDSRSGVFPVREPKISYNKVQDSYFLRFYELVEGERKRRYISVWHGKKLLTEKDAKKAKWDIWDRWQKDKDEL